MTHATDIVAYTYQTETLCPRCIIPALSGQGESVQPPTRDAERWLDMMAREYSIDRQDEANFDSFVFPKVVFASQVQGGGHCEMCADFEYGDDECCDRCGEPLI